MLYTLNIVTYLLDNLFFFVHFQSIISPSYILDSNTKSNIIPQDFQDNILRLYCRNRDKIDIVKRLYSSIKLNI